MADRLNSDADAKVRNFFGANAEMYSRSKSHSGGGDLKLLIEYLNLGGNESAVDMATGTGFTAVEIARRVSHVIAVDETREMLDKARDLAGRSGIGNIEFMLAHVNATGLESDSQDLITVRRAAHHFTEKARFISECHRILKTGGKLGFVDMVSPKNDPEDFFNRLEVARDNSHVGALSAQAWKEMIEDSGFVVRKHQVHSEVIQFSEWMYPVGMETAQGSECRKIVDEMLKKGKNPINYDPANHTRTKERVIIIAQKE